MNEEIEIEIPMFEDETPDGRPILTPQPVIENGKQLFSKELLTVDDVYDWLYKMEAAYPNISSFDMLLQHLRGVCPESLVDAEAVQLYRMEAAVKEYGIEALYLPMTYFKAFEMVRGSRNRFDNQENEKMKAAAKSKQN